VGVVGTPDELFVILQESRLQFKIKQRITRRHVTIPETVPTSVTKFIRDSDKDMGPPYLVDDHCMTARTDWRPPNGV
jgi:hypothetical protein